MEIKRDRYLNQLLARRNNGMVKVVTGIRRCGKSYLLGQFFRKHLLSEGVAESHLISLDMDSYANRRLRDPDALYEHVVARITDDQIHYILLDEIQLVDHFEDLLNGFLNLGNTDIYVTGSNARLLSRDVITEFRGRGEEIRMFPLSFKEYMSVYEGSKEQALDEFMLFGSLPQIFTRRDEEQKMDFLRSLFRETYLRDIVERYSIRNDADLEEVVHIMASSVGSLTNPLKLSNSFKSVKHSSLSYPTIKSYLDHMEDCFLIERSKRYDIKGRNYIDTPYKYYFTDLGLRNSCLKFNQIDNGHLMENLIYNELRVRGFNVDVGVVPTRRVNDEGRKLQINLEVDFVCNRGNKRYYVQSVYGMHDEAKLEQELASLLNIGDSYKKMVIVRDPMHIRRNEKGIVVMSIFDFLLNDDSMDM